MSQPLQEKLHQALEDLKSGEETGWLKELVEWLEETIEFALTVLAVPEGHRRRLRTTNGLERFLREIRGRSRVVGIFPNRRSCLRLAMAWALEQSEEWLTGHRYLDMEIAEEEEAVLIETS